MRCKSTTDTTTDCQKKIIAIDGPAGAGKSTVARLVAKRLGFLYIDTGAMYRALTLKIIKQNIDPQDKYRVIAAAKKLKIDLSNDYQGRLKITLDGKDVTKQIRKSQITRIVSLIAKIPQVRKVMLNLQRRLGQNNNAVLEGRDIGTVVFPYADKKFYLDASFKARVRRRYKEMYKIGQAVSFKEIESDLQNRDTIDSKRKVAPLKKAKDAIYIDTTDMTIKEVVNKVIFEIVDRC